MPRRAIVVFGIATLLILPLRAEEPAPFASFDRASPPVLANPHDLALGPDGKLHVSDVGNGRIAVLDPHTLALEGEIGAGALSQPHDVAFDANGRLLVADTGNDRIAWFEDGRLISILGESLSRPEGVAVHPDGRIIATGAGNDMLAAFAPDGTELARYAGPLSRPHDVAVAPDGRIWVADSGNDRVLVLDGDLELLATLDAPEYGWAGPRYLDFDADGNAVVADKDSHRIKRIDRATYRMTGSIGAGAGRGPGFFRTPEGVEIEGGVYWFSDSGNNRIVRYRVLTN